MNGLIRADLFRLARRREVILVVVGILAIHLAVFLQAFMITKADVDVTTAIPPPETGVEEFLRSQEAYRTLALAAFAAPVSADSVLRPGFPVLFVGLAFLAALAIGSDFEWGTIRAGVLLAGSRRRFVLVRHLTTWSIVIVTSAGLAGLGLVASQTLAMTGAPVGWTGGGSGPQVLAAVLVTMLEGMTYASVALAITILARSLAAGLIVTALWLGTDALVTVGLRSSEVAVRYLTISGAFGDLAETTRAVQPVVSLVVAVAWLAAAVALSVVAIERRDIVE
jgi:hypothetical protein